MALVPFSHASPFYNLRELPVRFFNFKDQNIKIEQAWKNDGKGGTALGFGAVVYDAAYVLSAYLEEHGASLLHNKNVLELGCGTGLVSIVASIMGAKYVLATDGDDKVVDLAAKNITAVEVPNFSKKCQAAKLLWGHDRDCFEIQNQQFDVIIAADIVACPYANAFIDLLQTLKRLVPEQSNAVVLLAYQRRHKSEKQFFEKIEQEFKVQYIPKTQLASDFQHHPIQLLRISRNID